MTHEYDDPLDPGASDAAVALGIAQAEAAMVCALWALLLAARAEPRVRVV